MSVRGFSFQLLSMRREGSVLNIKWVWSGQHHLKPCDLCVEGRTEGAPKTVMREDMWSHGFSKGPSRPLLSRHYVGSFNMEVGEGL